MPSLSSRDDCRSGKSARRLLALLLAFAVAAPTLFAQELDHINGRDKDHDPTGAWIIRNDAAGSQFILNGFHKGGTVTGDIQAESTFVPGVLPPDSVVNIPESGVWQKTGWKTFAVTVLTMEYDGNPPFALFQFDKIQYTAVLSDSGDRLEIPEPVVTNYYPDGKLKFGPFIVPTGAHGKRIPVRRPNSMSCVQS
jgi:hypothetical protein